MTTSGRCGRGLIALLGFALFATSPLPARSGISPSVTSVQLLVFQNRVDGVDQGWTFSFEITGIDLSAVTLTPPGRAPIVIPGNTFDRDYESAPYASLAALQADFPPAGTPGYVIDIDGFVTLNLAFAPLTPNGAGFFVSPTHNGGVNDTITEIVVDGSACTNCNVQVLNLIGQGPGMIDSSLFEFTTFSTTIPLASLDPPIASLPPDDYEACLSMAIGAIEPGFMNGGQTFELTRAGVDENCIEFSAFPAADVESVEMWVGEQKQAGVLQGWRYEVAVTGQNLVFASITPPGGLPLDLVAVDPEQLVYTSGPFASLGLLESVFPPSMSGGYLLSVNLGAETAALDFAPPVPDGDMTVITPANGATVGSQPSFTIANACSNCTEQFASIEDAASQGDLVEIDSQWTAPFPSVIDFAAFGANSGTGGSVVSGLPDGDYVFLAAGFNQSPSLESLIPPDEFAFFPGAYRADEIDFSVPEPGIALLQASALAALALLGRRSRRGACSETR